MSSMRERSLNLRKAGRSEQKISLIDPQWRPSKFKADILTLYILLRQRGRIFCFFTHLHHVIVLLAP